MSARSQRLLISVSLMLLALPAGQLRSQARANLSFAWVDGIQTSEEYSLRWPVAVACRSALEIAVAEAGEPGLLIFRKRQEIDRWELAQAHPLPATPSAVVFDGERYVVAIRQPGSLWSFAGEPMQPSRLELPAEVFPSALATDREGHLLIFDAAGSRILELDSSARVVQEISGLEGVVGLALGGSGTVLAAFQDPPEIRRWDRNGDPLEGWLVPGLAPDPAWPSGLATSARGSVVVTDRQGGRLTLIDARGEMSGWGGREGWDSGQLLRPADISRCAEGRFAVADLGNGRISIFQQLATD